MITKNETCSIDRCPSEFYGLSTDTKPTNFRNASIFYEMDTKKIYLFDEENGVWLEQ